MGEIRRRMLNTCEFCKNPFTERIALLKEAHFTSDLDKIRYGIVHEKVLKDCECSFLFSFSLFFLFFGKPAH